MNLYTILTHIPHESLRQLAGEFGVSLMSPSKRNLIHDVSARYRDQEFMSELFSELSEESQGLLRSLVYFTDPSSERIIIPPLLVKTWCTAKPLETLLDEIQSKGLLFHNFEDDERVILPNDVRRILRSLFQTEYTLFPLYMKDSEETQPNNQSIEAIFHLLSVLAHKRVQITQKGAVHKKIIELWKQRFDTSSVEVTFFDTLFSFGMSRNLVTLQNNVYKPAEVASEWFSLSETEMKFDLWRYVLNSIILQDKVYQQLLTLLFHAEKTILDSSSIPVFSTQVLVDSFSYVAKPMDIMSSEFTSRVNEFLSLMNFLGIINLNSQEMPTEFEFTPAGIQILFNENNFSKKGKQLLPSEPCTLQANFEILVPPTVNYATLWKLDQLSEFRQRDVITRFCFTRQSITHAMRLGWSTHDVLSFIEELTSGRVPDNVRFSLEEWCEKYGEITLKRTVVVECLNSELADEISHIPQIAELLEKRISKTHFMVRENEARRLMRLLQNHGYEPAPIH